MNDPEYLGEFLILFCDIFFGSKILSICCNKHQHFDYGCSSYPGMRLKVPILTVFLRFWTIFELFVLAQPFSLGQCFFTKISSMYMLSLAVTNFFMISSSEQYNAEQIFVKSVLLSGTNKVPFWAVLIRKTLNVVSV